MRSFLMSNAHIFRRLETVEHNYLLVNRHLSEHDSKFEEILTRLDAKADEPIEGVFFDGQIFDAYTLISDLIRSATYKVIIVDNYIDDSVLRMLDKRATGVVATIFTPTVSRSMRQDIERHNAQYPPIEVKIFRKGHDRFLIIDDTVYHVGASFKDLGKKLTAFSKMELMTADEFIAYLES
ncbi:MAG: hypothetical protein K2M17_05155 [Bacilli bacterium]|nr:hypothetical protein [Bacilli bacterium]